MGDVGREDAAMNSAELNVNIAAPRAQPIPRERYDSATHNRTNIWAEGTDFWRVAYRGSAENRRRTFAINGHCDWMRRKRV